PSPVKPPSSAASLPSHKRPWPTSLLPPSPQGPLQRTPPFRPPSPLRPLSHRYRLTLIPPSARNTATTSATTTTIASGLQKQIPPTPSPVSSTASNLHIGGRVSRPLHDHPDTNEAPENPLPGQTISSVPSVRCAFLDKFPTTSA